jgi:hypothetical protein
LAPESPPARAMEEASMVRIVPRFSESNKDELVGKYVTLDTRHEMH